MPRGCTLLPAPIITIEKQSKFTINEFYFEDFRRIVPDYMVCVTITKTISCIFYNLRTYLLNIRMMLILILMSLQSKMNYIYFRCI